MNYKFLEKPEEASFARERVRLHLLCSYISLKTSRWRQIVSLYSGFWRKACPDCRIYKVLHLFLKNGLKSSSLQSYTTFFHLIIQNDRKVSTFGRKRKKMNLKYIYWKDPWSEVWARTYIFQNWHQVDQNPCSQFRHTSQNFVLLLATARTSTKDVKELSMAKSKFISYLPR